jgi:hypothetical protein
MINVSKDTLEVYVNLVIYIIKEIVVAEFFILSHLNIDVGIAILLNIILLLLHLELYTI